MRISTNSFVTFRTVSKITKRKKNFYIFGDIDINVTDQLFPQAEKYLYTITSNGAFFLITKPTRVMESATVIDYVITNDVEHTVMPSKYKAQ